MTKIYSIPKPGDNNEDVKTFQRAINNNLTPLNIVPLDDDGDFGDLTKIAASAIQKKMGLAGTGIPGPKTLIALGLELADASEIPLVTKDLKGKKDRHLYINLRRRIEFVVFPGGKVPAIWHDRTQTNLRAKEILDALAGMDIKEVGGNNMGKDVGEIQGTTGSYTEGGNGDAWCEDVQQIPVAFLEDFYGVESPVPASPNVKATWDGASLIPGLTTQVCEIGTQAAGNYPGTKTGHAMGVTSVLPNDRMGTVEGNTGDKSMADGDVLTRKIRHQKKNGTLVTMGFIRQFPNNTAPKAV